MADEQKILLRQIKEFLAAKDTERLGDLLRQQRTSDIAEIVEVFDLEECRLIFDTLGKHDAAEVLEKVDEATRAELFDLFEDDELVDLISELDPDDAADVLAELDQEESQEVLESLDSEDAEQIHWLHGYSPYHRVQEGTRYPWVLVETADHDTRVYWGHSTKFAAALQEANTGANPILFYMEEQVGHGAGTRQSDTVSRYVRQYAFIEQALSMND